MTTSNIQLRGCVRFPRHMLKPKPTKCPLFTTRKILNILEHVSFDWTVNPARLILKAFLPHLTHNVDIQVILSQRLVFARLIELLSKNLNPDWHILIKQLRLKPFLYQLSLIWLHKCIYQNPAHIVQFLLTKRGFDSCWLCHRLHFPRPCKIHLIQQEWIQISTGNIFSGNKLYAITRFPCYFDKHMEGSHWLYYKEPSHKACCHLCTVKIH